MKANNKIILLIHFFFFLLFIGNCISLDNRNLEKIIYPSKSDELGFQAGVGEINADYFEKWCRINCAKLKNGLAQNKNSILEIKVRMDATETPKSSRKISQARAESLRQAMNQKGIELSKTVAIPDLDFKNIIGKDKFDPDNRRASFRLIEKN
jgi:hypothetical protein